VADGIRHSDDPRGAMHQGRVRATAEAGVQGCGRAAHASIDELDATVGKGQVL
jgi:hypothetical protein